MIKKITSINFGIFKNFDWDKTFTNGINFQKINIIYGRNYSGKTTLSRIVRSLETKNISEKYINPSFKIILESGDEITLENLHSKEILIRVFNEDFVRENLSFPYNDDGNIKSFAILGKDNKDLKVEIEKLENELGINEDERKTGLYKEREIKNKLFSDSKNKLINASDDLKQKLTNGARLIGGGSRNYNKNNLQQDINSIIGKDYKPITDENIKQYNSIINEHQKSRIEPLVNAEFDFNSIIVESKKLVEHKVGNSKKIEELVKDAQLNRWVKEGKKLQKGSSICAFCGNTITPNRWDALDKHFDEEYEELEKHILNFLCRIEEFESQCKRYSIIDEGLYYSIFNEKVLQLKNNSEILAKKTELFFKSLKDQILKKQNAMLEDICFHTPDDLSKDFDSFALLYNQLANENNQYTSQLATEQQKAKQQLQLDEVYRFSSSINYINLLQTIETLEKEKQKNETEVINTNEKITSKLKEIEDLDAKMSNEKEGAKKINEFLSLFFDSNHLQLDVTNENSEQTEKQNTFFILRDGVKAFNLSEGECHIIAFCYFMAKLEEQKEFKPIIWIDDPICSLDDNHIFSVYSALYSNLIKEEKNPDGTIIKTNKYDQIFISTHSLNFLKYLKRYKGEENQQKEYFLIQRTGNNSIISKMPKYMENYATEFNFLFKQIFLCAELDKLDDTNYTVLYNFGNNARKFLEIYSYYKFPDMFNEKNPSSAEDIRLKKLWGENTFDSILSGRLNNEYSHLAGSIERGEQIVDVPEIKKVAKLICNKLKEIDKEQFEALKNSIK